MNLFDLSERVYKGPALYSEPDFNYLNRSARNSASAIREQLEQWFRNFPDDGKPDLLGRFRSKNNVHHASAFFELFLSEILCRLECRLSVHPEIFDQTRHPDFGVESPIGKGFYLEAVVATGESAELVAANNRRSVVYDVLNRLESPDFFFHMELKGAPNTSPPTQILRQELKNWVSGLDWDSAWALYTERRYGEVQRWFFEHDGCKVEFTPFPKSPKSRGRPGLRPMASRFSGFLPNNARIRIRESIEAKAGRYGTLDLPYVVAVNVLESRFDTEDVMDALFGETRYVINWDLPVESAARPTREPDGVWCGKAGPNNTRVSAVLILDRLSPWNIVDVKVCLYHNLWASMKYDSQLTHLNQAVPEDDRMELIPGELLSSILDLPSGWPEFFNRL